MPFGASSSWRGDIAVNYRHFFHDGLYSGQIRDDASLILEPEYSLTWPSGNFLVISPYGQIDSSDSERTHFDFRELFFTQVGDSYELSIGMKKVFWGVVESQNIVDVINQTDFVAMGRVTDKLGQPMANLTLIRDWGTVDLFVLPFFRERTFPGSSGRLRYPLPVDTDRAEYESGAGQTHPDFALRYSHYIGELEFGLSCFQGTSRDPDIRPAGFVPDPELGYPVPTVLYPYYYQMTQFGLDLQYILGGWLLKAEVINRQNDLDSYSSWVTGFEYTFTTVFDTETDISILSEWLYDDRLDESTTLFDNDLMVATRIALNDINSSEITLALFHDIEDSSCLLTLEGSRRITDHLKINLDMYLWYDIPRDDRLYYVRDDDYISLTLAYYF
jgi:hypothetical protein